MVQQKANSHTYLLLELLSLFILVPTLMYFLVPLPVLPILWIFAFFCTRLLLRDRTFDRASFWRVSALQNDGKQMLMQFLIIAALLFTLVYFFMPGYLFSLMVEKPLLWLLILIFYPLLSVYPQELMYRTFFFHRYRALFSRSWQPIILSALLFGYMHIIFHNWIAVLLTLGGGLIFASMYVRTRSTLLVSIAHALYGDLLFTIGLGEFFYNGTIGTITETFKL